MVGTSTRQVVADFIIGAHAVVQADQLPSRDRGTTRARLETGRTLPLGSWSLASLVWPTTLGTQPSRGLPQGGTKNRLRCRTPSRATQRNRQPPACLSGNAPLLTPVDPRPASAHNRGGQHSKEIIE